MVIGFLLGASLVSTGCRSVDLSPSREPIPEGIVRIVGPGDAGALDTSTGSDGAAPAFDVTILSPTDGAHFDQASIVGGEWVAAVTFEVASAGVARVELVSGGTVMGEVDATGELTYAFAGEGEIAVDAVGYDAAGIERARDSVSVVILAPLDTSCHAMLDALGMDWTEAGASRGIADPVNVEPWINGVAFRYISRAEPTTMLMDCELGVRLHALTELLEPYGIDEVVHIGVYNYRCIGGGDPDSGTCTPSQHAYARAIDIHALGFTDRSVEYNTETDWVITSRGDPCPIESFSDEDRILKELACAMFSNRIFQIVLTPNYNTAHRNHFHVDMTEGAMLLGQGVGGVDPVVGVFGD